MLVAQSECMLNRQRREKPLVKAAVARGERVVRERFGVDSDTCTGDHSCIRLSGCPSLSIKANPDPLRTDPVATVLDSCVGCGVCGEVSHAAVLCPSFYKARIVSNPTGWDRFLARVRARRDRRAAAARRARGARASPSDVGCMSAQPIKIAILAIGGEGGGVLSDWIVELAEQQRLPRPGDLGARRRPAHRRDDLLRRAVPARATPKRPAPAPVLALMPMPGDVDIVLASELMEAARAVQRGLVTPDRTTLIASTHRVWSIAEKTALGDGRVDATARSPRSPRRRPARWVALRHGRASPTQSGSVISAVLFGALAGSGALPFARAGVRGDDRARRRRRRRRAGAPSTPASRARSAASRRRPARAPASVSDGSELAAPSAATASAQAGRAGAAGRVARRAIREVAALVERVRDERSGRRAGHRRRRRAPHDRLAGRRATRALYLDRLDRVRAAAPGATAARCSPRPRATSRSG